MNSSFKGELKLKKIFFIVNMIYKIKTVHKKFSKIIEVVKTSFYNALNTLIKRTILYLFNRRNVT